MSIEESSKDFEATQVHVNQIGRYRIEDLLGSGGFGHVYLAFDEKLERRVAIKVPHEEKISAKNRADDYLQEAKMAATLDHPNIVPVFDVGSTDEFECYVVSKYIAGTDLRKLIKNARPNVFEAVKLVAAIAEGLHHAHKRGIVHRDIKPSNVLIDEEGTPYIADFGLALQEHRIGKGPRFAGTPAYMSPEQARGEGHRVDGRSDIFSLGAVMYELLTGKRAFRGETKSDLVDQIEHVDPRPLRQQNERLPKELDRICQKALAKRASERYWTAHDMAEDLRAFIQQSESLFHSSDIPTGSTVVAGPESNETMPNSDRRGSVKDESNRSEGFTESQPTAVLPKGLRPFDAHDSDFFLELLPGPRDRDGLPDSLRFWKTRIEARDRDDSFAVGMIYGPSGCGKSSFVRAGLVPRLDPSIIPIFVESTAEFTETRLLELLRKNCPGVNQQLGLADTIASLRQGEGIAADDKIVIFFDQFERWLHARQGPAGRELTRALRQCDGERVQAILMVRSDFWMSVTRLLNELEIDLVQGINFATVDLFPPRHARKVLSSFGRAFGALPANGQLNSDQQQFINQSIEELSDDGKLVCVRLALYAEMMQNKPWTPATLKQMGGFEGVGVAFLEESFGPQANPRARVHQPAARRVLKSLLPDSGTVINIQMKPYDELLQASGYKSASQFDELIQVLDGEMRLISPTDPSGVVQEDSELSVDAPLDDQQKYFRLAHDYLVIALRKWLNRKLRENRRGRAELLLAERTSFWRAKKENRYLPTFLEHWQIRSNTSAGRWNADESAMMSRTTKVHGIWLAGLGVALAAVVAAGIGFQNSQRQKQFESDAVNLVDRVVMADTSNVSTLISKLDPFQPRANELMEAKFESVADGGDHKLHAAMAIASNSPAAVEYLFRQLPTIDADRLLPVCTELKKSGAVVPPDLEAILVNAKSAARPRLRIACMIAQLVDGHDAWTNSEVAEFVAAELTRTNPSELAPFREALAPVAESIAPHLQAIFVDINLDHQQRFFATETLVAYWKESPEALFQLLLDCDSRQFPLVFRALKDARKLTIQLSKLTLQQDPPEAATEREHERALTHQANAAVALFQLEEVEAVWDVWANIDDDQGLESLIIHWIHAHGSDPSALVDKVCTAPLGPVLQSAMLALGEYPPEGFSQEDLAKVIQRAKSLWDESEQARYKSTAQWLLKRLQQGEYVHKKIKELTDSRNSDRINQRARLAQLKRKSVDARSAWRASVLKRSVQQLAADEETQIRSIALADMSEVILRPNRDQSEDFELTSVPGPNGTALQFDGETQLELREGKLPRTSQEFTFGCWFRIGDEEQWGALFSKMDSSNGMRGFDVWIERNQVCAHIKNNYTGEDDPENRYIKVAGNKMVNDDRWHEVVISYDGTGKATGVKIAIDGEFVQKSVFADTLTGEISNDVPLIIGGRPSTERYCIKGDISNVRIVGRDLTDEEIRSDYLAQIQSLVQQDSDRLNPVQTSLVERSFVNDQETRSEFDNVLIENAEKELRQILASRRDWFVDGEGHMMIRLKAQSMTMGDFSRNQDDMVDDRFIRNIHREFAISSMEVTVGQWSEFLPSLNETSRLKFERDNQTVSQRPIVNVSWLEAAHYCNWLSEREGIPQSEWCYEPDPEGGYSVNMRTKPRFWELKGYRLPTQSEWEYACRANSQTRRCYGNRVSLLPKYAWFQDNTEGPQPVALLKPNRWGLHDMHGNAMEWCFDLYELPINIEDRSPDFPTGTGTVTPESRELRGGAFYDIPKYVTSSNRYYQTPDKNLDASGFRVVRTLRNLPAENENDP